MKTNQAPHQTHRIIGVTLLFLALSLSAWANGLTNNFDVSFNYLANGIVGDTKWDGVYLRLGDVFLGNNGGDGNGNSTTVDANNSVPSALTYQGTAGSWAGAGDDGFFLWKYVTGDFDVSVEILGPYPPVAFQFAGLMVRLYNTNNSGSPFSYDTNAVVENQSWLARFQQFNNAVDSRWTTNGADAGDHPFAGSDTNSSAGDNRFYRITRVGSTFTYYYKTNYSDTWALLNSASLPSIVGPVQVGIMDADFTGNSAGAVFTDFELVSSSVSFPAMPPAPSALVTTATNTSGSLTLSWTKGNAGDNSLVVMRRNASIGCSPINGITYTANSAFGDTNTLLACGGEYVVYNGSGNSVTVSSLGANNLNYSVAVYEYSGSGASTVYNTASPAVNTFPGPGVITAVQLTMDPTNNIPVSGAASAHVFANFSTGESGVDVSTGTTWGSSDTSVAIVGSDGTVSGVGNGTATITGTFGPFSPTTNITVRAPIFTDNFAGAHDYIANGLQGVPWDGLYLNYGDVSGANVGAEGTPGQTFIMTATNEPATNDLFLQEAGGSWRLAGNDGPYLFKIVTGDFQASVHVIVDTINNNAGGIMARLFDNSGNPTQGHGGGTGGTETHINIGNPQQNIPTIRRTIDSGGTTIVPGLAATDRWLLMQRVNSTNFLFFEKNNAADPWIAIPAATMVIAEASNSAPMQVGLYHEMRQATTGVGRYDTFMLDGPGIVSPTGVQPPPPATNLVATLNPDLTMTFSWTVPLIGGAGSSCFMIMRQDGPVTAQPPYGLLSGTGVFNYGAGTSLGSGNYVVYRENGLGVGVSNITITVGGLTPGHTYSVAVYPFVGSGGSKVFNNVLPPSGATATLLDGVLQNVQVLPVPSIPLGGIALPQVLGFFGGPPVNVTAFSTWTIADTNIAQMAPGSGAVSGMGIGSTTAKVVYGVGATFFTNTVSLTVRAPIFTDDFGSSHDYLASGVSGTTWDGVYRQQTVNEVPDGGYVIPPLGGTTVADANISSNNILTIVSSADGWENELTGGFFLFKYVPGDFQMAIHIQSYEINAYQQPGLLARAYKVALDGTTLGAAAGPTNSENWVSFIRFDEFGFGTYARLNIDSAVQQSTQPDQGDLNWWLLMIRTGDTNFNFFKRQTNTAPWVAIPNKTAYHQMEFAGAPMQVGIMAGPWSSGGPGDPRTVHFEHFMLDRTTGTVLTITESGANVIISWPPTPTAGTLQTSLSVSPTSWSTVPGTPTLVNGQYQMTVPISHNTSFFRLVQ